MPCLDLFQPVVRPISLVGGSSNSYWSFFIIHTHVGDPKDTDQMVQKCFLIGGTYTSISLMLHDFATTISESTLGKGMEKGGGVSSHPNCDVMYYSVFDIA